MTPKLHPLIATRPLTVRARRRLASRRQGALIPFACIVFVVMLVLSTLCVNIAYIEMVRTEQRLATDAAAKGALVVLGQSQSIPLAKTTAIDIASRHMVAGSPLELRQSDIEVGTSIPQANNSYSFQPSNAASPTETTNAIRVRTDLRHRPGGGVALTIAPDLIGSRTYAATQQATATRIEMDVCLVLDRSGSMAWDLGSTPFQYPGALFGKSPMQNYFQLADPDLSRWAALRRSLTVFLDVLKSGPIETRVAMASYSSNFTFGVFQSTVASLDQPLTYDYSTIDTRAAALATRPLIGNTNIAAGLREGINELLNPDRLRITSSKSIILLTDGILSQGDDPVALAAQARALNVRTHTIAFSAQADIGLMQRVAAAGGGQCYIAPDAATLTSAFRTIAATLPNMLTD